MFSRMVSSLYWLRIFLDIESFFCLSFPASGLKLYVAKDGTTALSSQQMLQGMGGKYEQVVIDHTVMDQNR